MKLNAKTNRRRQRRDRLAATVVKLGGVGVVAAVLFLAAFLISQAAPLASSPEVARTTREVVIAPGVAGGVDPYAEVAWTLSAEGILALNDLESAAPLQSERPLEFLSGETVSLARLAPDGKRLSFVTSTGRLGSIGFEVGFEYDEAARRVHQLQVRDARWLVEAPGAAISDFAVLAEGERTWFAVLRAGEVEFVRARAKTNRMTGEQTLDVRTLPVPDARGATAISLLENGALVAAAPDGRLSAWRGDKSFRALQHLGSTAAGAGVALMQPMIGVGSLLVAREDGVIDRAMFRAGESAQELVIPHGMGAPVEGLHQLAVSTRQRVFLAVGDARFRIGHATAQSFDDGHPLPSDLIRVAIAPREDYIVLFREGVLELRELDLKFPAVNSLTLLGKIQYEGLPESEYSWQSTGGTDDYESKISFVPLIIGTLKGTFWALLPSIPLAVLGALYTARFLRGRARETIKPLVELLAGIPSVVLGFLGAMWIAPAIEERMVALILVPIVLTIVTCLLGAGWARLPLAARRRFHEGQAPLLLIPLYGLIAWLLFSVGPGLESTLFGMPFRTWAATTFDVTIEQRNAVVVGLAMGFAVTPLIYTLAEDSFRNVPKDLSDASLALGATPWQTALRVILPPALPGVISAIMLGLGRAVGETMIVLMATGNTAIDEWNPLQGFRALSANLAVELPEADHGGSLYRTLFLSALVLFAMTFVVNTLAEVIRVRGRKEL